MERCRALKIGGSRIPRLDYSDNLSETELSSGLTSYDGIIAFFKLWTITQGTSFRITPGVI